MTRKKLPYLFILLASFFVLSQGFAATIYGYKFLDLNGNGVDNNDPRLSGFTIVLSSQTDPGYERQTVTNGNGQFNFSNLPVGTYDICEIAPVVTPPWVPTTPECVTVTLRGKNSQIQVRFGNEREEDEENGGCTRTQGYWGSSPAGQALVPILVPGTMSLGTTAYSAGHLDDILDTPPVGGNALQSLAHQLISANLNILAGASAPAQVTAAITQANILIGSLVIIPVGSGFVASASTLGQQMLAEQTILDDYNNGLLGVPHCSK
jgi:hypothetical protein